MGEEVAIGRSFLHEEVAIRRSLLQGKCQGEVAIRRSLLQGRCRGTRRSRDQEIAPTGEVSGGGRDQEIAPTAVRDGECVAIGRRGRDQEIAPTGGGRDQEIAPTAVRDRDQEIAPTGEVSGGGRDQEIAPTGEGEVAIRRSLLQGKMSLKKNKAVEFPPPLCRLVHIDLSLKHLCYSRDDFNSPQVVVALPAAPMCPLRRCARVRVWRFPSNETSSIW